MVAATFVSNLPAPEPAASMAQERARAAFDPAEMHQILEGTPEKAQQILGLYQLLERDPVLAPSFYDYEMSRDENRLQTTRRIARMAQYVEKESPEDFWRRLGLVTAYDPSLGIRIAVNLGLFVNCIKGNGTAAQYKYWCVEKEARHMKQVWGCFGMTELAHGSNAAGVETTATFDEKTDEFVINTPHIGATKWWIGGAAHSATHSSVYARLIVNGKDYGVKTFVVPLRDSQHNLMPGVSIGDIGSKMGREGVDNGWIQFSGVRIPRFFMLQKFCRVERDGTVKMPPLEQLSYISLLEGRVGMAADSYRICARFITIAVRYAVGRRQFKKEEKKKDSDNLETQLLDYPLHQRRLMPYLALTYAAALGTDRLERQHKFVVSSLEEAVNNDDQNGIKRSLGDTKALFVDSAALKSTLTWLAERCLSETRQACGGLGYSAYSGFGQAYADWAVQCTWEGDNSVLGMSAGRSVMKKVADVLTKKSGISHNKVSGQGKTLSIENGNVSKHQLGVSKTNLRAVSSLSPGLFNSDTLSFLDNASSYLTGSYLESDFAPKTVLTALEALIVRVAASALESKDGWDLVSYERVLLSRLRCHQYLLHTLVQVLDRKKTPDLQEPLEKVARLYALTSIVETYAREFIAHGIMSGEASLIVTSKLIPQLCLEVRQQAIPLTDSFQIPDTLLNSAIGTHDGNWYENYFRVVKSHNDARKTKAPYSHELEGFLNRPNLDARERHERGHEAQKKLSG